MPNAQRERRTVDGELRVDGASRTIIGRIPYNVETVIGYGGWGFREVIRPTFFRRAIAERDDVVAQAQHGEGYLPFARTTAGNLVLVDHSDHLEWRAEAIEASDVDELIARIRSRVINATSFAFTVDDEDNEQARWDRSEKDKLPLRELLSAERVYDVSPVVFAAYETTEVGLRSAEAVYQHQLQSSLRQVPADDDSPVSMSGIDIGAWSLAWSIAHGISASSQEREDARRVVELMRLRGRA